MRGSPPERHPSRRRSVPRLAAATAVAAVLVPVFVAAPSAVAGPPRSSTLQRAFASAAQHYRVPQSVLLGVSYLESRWDTHAGRPSVTGGYGPMHLTDARTAIAGSAAAAAGDAQGDQRGDVARPLAVTAQVAVPKERALPASLRTADRAAALTGLSNERLREDPAANVAGGAALLAAAQKALGRPLSADPADWFGAVARYSGADDTASAADFADDVFQTIRDGAARTDDSGQHVVLAAVPGLRPDTAQADALGLRTADADGTECPPHGGLRVGARAVRAVREHPDRLRQPRPGGPAARLRRSTTSSSTTPRASWDVTLKLVQDPTYLGWHYTVRSSDGHIAAARGDQGRRLARRQLVRQRQVDRHRARGLPRRSGRLVHRGDVPPARPGWCAT